MSATGADDMLAAARRALLDVLEALRAHSDAVVVIGAQAIYLHTGGARVALAEMTRDSDVAIDVRALGPHPLIEEAMLAGGFRRDTGSTQPGSWISRDGTPVDLMVPEALVDGAGRRGARIPPHAKHAARRAVGLEAAVVDHRPMTVQGLAGGDSRAFLVNVASPAALLVAKLHKLGERRVFPRRLLDKDAHDVYRLLVACSMEELRAGLRRLGQDELSAEVTRRALRYLDELFAAGPDALGSSMAGRAEEGIGDPQVVAASVAALAGDLAESLPEG